MANNTTINIGNGGDSITDVDLATFGANGYPAVGKLPCSCLYVSAVLGSVPSPVTDANPLPAILSDGTNAYVGAKTGQLPASLGQKTMAGSLPVVLPSDQPPLPTAGQAGEAHLGEVGGNSEIITLTPAITAAAYAAGNNVGGLLTLANALRPAPNARFTGLLQSLLVIDHANQKAPLDVLLFTSAPAGVFTDRAAMPVLTQADAALVRRRISIAAGDYVTVGGTAFADLGALGKLLKGATATLYAAVAIAAGGAPTYAAVTDLTLNFGFLRD